MTFLYEKQKKIIQTNLLIMLLGFFNLKLEIVELTL